MPISYTTKVITYRSERAMQQGIRREQAHGWEVVSTNVAETGRGCLKNCLFGIFSLFMRKPRLYQVTFRKSV